MKIIFAQGNPESDFTNTRHNVGFAVLNSLADSLDAKWTNRPKFHAFTAEVTIAGEKTLLIKPTTFYNETGTSARKIIDFYKVDPVNDLLIIHDDLSLPFGTTRTRQKGSDAGNNGIKSLNSHLGQDFVRVRIGISNDLRERMDDTTFVLAKFSVAESKKLSEIIIPHIIDLINKFCSNNLQITSHKTLE